MSRRTRVEYDFSYLPPPRKASRGDRVLCKRITDPLVPHLKPRVVTEEFRVGTVTVNGKPIALAVNSKCDSLWPTVVTALHPADFARIRKKWTTFGDPPIINPQENPDAPARRDRPVSATPLVDALEADLRRKQVSPLLSLPTMTAQARTLERELRRYKELHDLERRCVADVEHAVAMRWIYAVVGMCGGALGTALAFAVWMP